MERKGSDRQDICESHNINDYPKELSKKVTLL